MASPSAVLLGTLCLPGCYMIESVANSQRYEVIAIFLGYPCCQIAGVVPCLAQMLQSEQINVKEAAASVVGVLQTESEVKALIATGRQKAVVTLIRWMKQVVQRPTKGCSDCTMCAWLMSSHCLCRDCCHCPRCLCWAMRHSTAHNQSQLCCGRSMEPLGRHAAMPSSQIAEDSN